MVEHDALQFGALVAATMAVGLSIVMFVSVERSRPNALLASGTFVAGLAILTVAGFIGRVDPVHPSMLARLQGIFEAMAIVIYSLYMRQLLTTSSITPGHARIVRACIWTTIAGAGWHTVASFTWPAARLNDYELQLAEPGSLANPGFWLFAGFWLALAVPYSVGWSLLAVGDIDPAEARRAISAAIGSVAIIAATAAPAIMLPVVVAAWISLVLYGQIQYVNAHAQRAVFLSRFLSPRVTEQVAARGLAETMKPHLAEITVVCADLRGFTAYSEAIPSHSVVDLLAEYYDCVGNVVSHHGGTITNYAGDGILIVVGAPLADPNHAATGLQIAREISESVGHVLTRWQTPQRKLGIGVGVASGNVTVGAIAADTRMEYTAIGMPVNLAARLCSAATAGEVLVDAQAARLSGINDLQSRGERPIKGFSELQQVYAFPVDGN